MTLEGHLATAITEDSEIAGLFLDDAGDPRDPETWFFAASSLGLGEHPARPDCPYVVWNELADLEHPEARETSDSRTRTFSWYVYDKPGDFTLIDLILYKIKRRIKLLDHFTTAGGVVCMKSEWLGTSGQIPSDGYASSTKFGTSSHTVSR